MERVFGDQEQRAEAMLGGTKMQIFLEDGMGWDGWRGRCKRVLSERRGKKEKEGKSLLIRDAWSEEEKKIKNVR